MSGISDEIRKVADEYDVLPLYKLEGRIDAEMVELPKDRDGVPIHVGDTVYLEDGRMALVTEISIKRDWVAIDCWDESKHVTYDPSGITHTRHDSWERIADELEEWSEDNRINGDSEVFDRASIFADRIRKMAKKEE